MKRKIISFLLACAISSLLIPSTFAQEYECVAGWEAYKQSWGSIDPWVKIIEDEVDGVTKPVVQWRYTNEDAQLRYPIGYLEPGTYTLSMKVKSQYNMGNATYGISSNYDSGNMSTNFTNGAYLYRERDITVPESDASVFQTFRIQTQWGDADIAYISDISLKKKNDDGSYGPELFDPISITKGYDNYWSFQNEYSHEVINEYVIDGLKNVLKVTFKNGDGTTIYADIKNNTLEAGDYQISVTSKSPNNAGDTRVGVILDSNGGFPANSSALLSNFSPSYTTKTKTITITRDNAYVNQKLCIKTGWGDDNCPLYLADIKLQKINEDGTLGENRIVNPDFTVREIPSNEVPVRGAANWSKYYGSSAFTEQDNFTVRTVTDKDGNETRALVGYKAANNTALKAIVQYVPTKAGKTYRVTYDYKQMGAVKNFGTRMGSASEGGFSETYVAADSQGATDWQTKTYDYVMGATDAIDNFLAFSLEDSTFEGEQLVYIDNVTLQEVIDEDTLGENLIVNGDFEQKGYNANVFFDIYDEANSSVTGGEGYSSIPGFSLDALGYKMVAEATVINDDKDPIKPVLIVAVYDNGVLSGLETVEASVASGATEKWYGVVDLPGTVGNGTLVAKAFVWDSLSSLKPISVVEQVEEVEE